MEATREIYWNISAGGLIYAFMAAALIAVAVGIRRRVQLWQLGGPEARFDRIPQRIQGVLVEVFGQRRQLRDPYMGVAHLLIFYGFFAMLIATGLISIQEWTGIHFLKGDFYRGYSLLSDVFGLLGIVGIAMALWNRGVRRPARVKNVMDDWVALALLGLLFVQGFFVEGLRIATTELAQQPELARWSPGGYVVALGLSGLDEATLRSIHRVSWWFHAVTAFGFIGYFVFGKFSHVLFGLAGIFLRDLEGKTGRLHHPDIESMLDEDEDALDRLGRSAIDQFSWKDLLDVDACVNCGRCETVCPAHESGVPLNPRKLIQDMHHHLTEVGPGLRTNGAGGDVDAAEAPSGGPLLFGEADGEVRVAVLEEELWGCRTCGACMQECPMYIEHIPKIIDMRRHLVMTEAKMPEEAQTFLKNMDDRMHPFAGTSRDREEWFQDLDVKLYANGDQADTLFWVGCAGSMIDRNIEVSRALVKVMQKAGVDFALLGNEEVCSGDPARRAGGELTYQICAKQNIETFEQYGIKRVVTACPHCFNTIGNEYSEYGGDFEVVHHSELIADLIAKGDLDVQGKLEDVTYHDPCYLGRHNGVYDAPRDVLGALSAAGGVNEMERSKSESRCCGSGGGYAWMDDDPDKRINHRRFEDVKACGATTAAVGCPFCTQMFEDASGALDPGKEIRVADIAELVAEAIDDGADEPSGAEQGDAS